jgi:hypothetical protein
MAVYKIFAEKDATLYSNYPNENTGLDEILEIGNTLGGDTGDAYQVMRPLIKFSTSDIQEVLDNKVSGSAFTASLKLYLAEADSIPVDFSISCFRVSGSWNMGTGKFQDSPENNTGVSWEWKSSATVNPWIPAAYSSSVTASYASGYDGGGTYIYTNEATQSFSYNDVLDIAIDVTSQVRSIYSSSLNDGFLLKLQDSLEFQSASYFELKYFSVDTHTIYPPVLEFGWNDSVFSTGSKSIINDTNFVVTFKNNQYEYQRGSIQRFRLEARPQFPVRTFTTSSVYLTSYYLPQNSYYQIVDMDTEEVVVAFDNNNTKISADSTSSYFDIYMNGLQPERYYKIFIKTTLDGSTVIRDGELTFKVTQ